MSESLAAVRFMSFTHSSDPRPGELARPSRVIHSSVSDSLAQLVIHWRACCSHDILHPYKPPGDLHNVSPCVLANSIHPSPDSIHRRAHNFRLISLLIRRLMRPNQDTIHSDAEDTIERGGRVSRSDR